MSACLHRDNCLPLPVPLSELTTSCFALLFIEVITFFSHLFQFQKLRQKYICVPLETSKKNCSHDLCSCKRGNQKLVRNPFVVHKQLKPQISGGCEHTIMPYLCALLRRRWFCSSRCCTRAGCCPSDLRWRSLWRREKLRTFWVKDATRAWTLPTNASSFYSRVVHI